MLSYTPCYNQYDQKLYLFTHTRTPATTETPNTDSDGSGTTAPSTNEPTTPTRNDLTPTTENMPTTTEDIEETSTITDAQRSPARSSQSTASPGVIAGAAIGGILLGALLTLATLIILAIISAKLSKNKQSMLALLAVNRIIGKEDEMKKGVEEPVYSVVLPNPAAGSDHQVDMNKNDCYGTLRRT